MFKTAFDIKKPRLAEILNDEVRLVVCAKANNASNPYCTAGQISIGALDAVLRALFETGTIADNKIARFFGLTSVKSVLQRQMEHLLLNLAQHTGQHAKINSKWCWTCGP
jgi:hypothetical protein